MGNTKESIVQTLSEKKNALQGWAEEKSNNFGLRNFFSRFRRNTDDDEEESVKKEIDFDSTK